jgi:hypothetical protein
MAEFLGISSLPQEIKDLNEARKNKIKMFILIHNAYFSQELSSNYIS